MAFFVLLLLFEANMPPASDNIPILGKWLISAWLSEHAKFVWIFPLKSNQPFKMIKLSK